MTHNFKTHPELTNSQMQLYYFESPHKQITEDFRAKVVKIHDGDTITLRTDFRDFDFPLRFLDTNAPELNEEGGHESRDWLSDKILNKEVDILIDKKNRVGKWGRLLGSVFFSGMNINKESIVMGQSTSFSNRNEGKLPIMNKELNMSKWF